MARCGRSAGVVVIAAMLAAGIGSAPLAAAAAAPQGPQPQLRERRLISASPTDTDGQRADEVRDRFRQVLDRYPPELARVLKLDPTLMTDAAYLAPYPDIAAFLQQHPQVAHDAPYFLEFVRDPNAQPTRDNATELRMRAMEMWQDSLAGFAVLVGVLGIAFAITWLVRYIVAHRRWLRSTRIQAELHGKLLERFASNAELLTYAQSPAGRALLTPLAVGGDPAAPPLAAPFTRILWSLQAGLVLASAGIGLLIVRHYVIEEVSQMMLVIGVLGIALGVGFGLASAASYMLSQRLGLFDAAGRRAGAPDA